ncbi:MAG: DUF4003 domain-containing protein [Bifidobacteriaceae bacterium]|jgi:hypothetical protein|nr:DUF4003 domain-containing protein [Bifidobacteriaceae bacterium]
MNRPESWLSDITNRQEITLGNPIETRLELLASNAQVIRQGLRFEDGQLTRLVGLLFALEGKTADVAAIRQCRDLIKAETSVFSPFRSALAVAGSIALAPDPASCLDQARGAYQALRDAKFQASAGLALAACQIALRAGGVEVTAVADRARAFYSAMKDQHWFLTSENDVVPAVLLGLSALDVGPATERMEEIYGDVKPSFASGDAAQAATQILVLGGASKLTVQRVIDLKDGLQGEKMRPRQVPAAVCLGLLALLGTPAGQLVNEMAEARDFLRDAKGFGRLSAENQEILMHCASIIASYHAADAKDQTAGAVAAAVVQSMMAASQAMIVLAVSLAVANSTAAAAQSY